MNLMLSIITKELKNYPKFQVNQYPKVSELSNDEKYRARQRLWEFISQNRTHIITGGYSMGNIDNRSNNALIQISNSPGSFLWLNYNPDRSHLMISGEIDLALSQFLTGVLQSIENIFLFTSGEKIISLVKDQFSFDRKLNNTVYILEKSQQPKYPTDPNIHIITDRTSEYYESLGDFYHYEDHIPENSVHVIYVKDNEIIAGARTNEYNPQISIIGGVKTLQNHRRQGIGKIVCSVLSNYLADRSDLVALETDIDNFPAMKIYKNIGFQEVGKSAFYQNKVDIISSIIGDRDY